MVGFMFSPKTFQVLLHTTHNAIFAAWANMATDTNHMTTLTKRSCATLEGGHASTLAFSFDRIEGGDKPPPLPSDHKLKTRIESNN